MRRALNLLRSELHERKEAFSEGLRQAGFEVVGSINKPERGDALLTWNVLGRDRRQVDRFRSTGAWHFVAENGYLGHSYNERNKPFAKDGEQLHAISLQHHNGAGRICSGHVHRWKHQGIEVREWRKEGNHVLILGQRGIGEPGIAMPRDWPNRVLSKLRGLANREVWVRAHPGRSKEELPSLEEDLSSAWCVVTWSSNAALRAMCMGVPVLCDFPKWIGRPGSLELAEVNSPMCCDEARERVLERVSWGQWTRKEIAMGEPFRRLMEG